MDSRYAAWAARWRVPLGFALAAAYVVFAQPTFPFLLAGGAIALAGLLLRAFSAGYLAKNRLLATGGPYAYTRNPLYLGSSLIGLGFGLASGSWGLGVAFLAYFLAVYWPVMLREAQFLRREFGAAYDQYAEAVPLFFPRLGAASGDAQRFSWELYRNNREYEAALGSAAGLLFLALKLWLR
jgi:protein-S-isoprenylcysteine O-methyltransferase Ste14